LPDPALEAARDSLRAARILVDEGLYRDAVSRAYYAMFSAAKVLLAKRGVQARTHGGVLQALGEHFVKKGTLDAEVVGHLGFAMQLRQRADYGDLEVTAADAQAVLRRAAEFVPRIESVLETE
jgi:uncharacterized protein (UPF0332 family)